MKRPFALLTRPLIHIIGLLLLLALAASLIVLNRRMPVVDSPLIPLGFCRGTLQTPPTAAHEETVRPAHAPAHPHHRLITAACPCREPHRAEPSHASR